MARLRKVLDPGERPALPTCDRLWSTQETAEFLGVPVASLHQWRYLGVGPAAFRVGKYLRYDPAAVRTWLVDSCSGARREA